MIETYALFNYYYFKTNDGVRDNSASMNIMIIVIDEQNGWVWKMVLFVRQTQQVYPCLCTFSLAIECHGNSFYV